MSDSVIRIVNARQHNLKGINVELPHRSVDRDHRSVRLGQELARLRYGLRRGSAALHRIALDVCQAVSRSDAEAARGPARGSCPSVAIEQRNPTVSSRSTVGTATEVYDYLRLLWARAGRSFCRACGAPVRRDTPQSAADDILAAGTGPLQITFPLPPVARLTHEAVVENLTALGFVRVLVDGTTPPSG